VWVAALAATSLSSVGVASSGAGTVAGTIVLKAGTIELVERGEELTGGASIVVRDGRILAVGKSLDIPPGAQVIDYGADAVIVPGLVSASSYYGIGMPSRRTADPMTRAVDNYDTYSDSYLVDLMGGVTTAYFAPTMGRLIGGQGAVIKLAGDESGRVLRDSASIDGTITAQARAVPGYWDPPVPATIDVGLGVVEQQLPGSAMGAGIALHELISFARGNAKDTGAYGPETARALRELMQANLPWRMGAETEQEIRVLLELAKSEHLPLVIAGGASSGKVASDIAAAGAAVVVQVSAHAEGDAIDFGKGENAVWPTYDNAVRLVAAGVRTAIAPGLGMRVRDLRFAAGLASRGGLDPKAALRAITLGAAEILGVEGRVGSIVPGKDADFCVLTGAPISSGASVIATWVDGKVAWQVGMRSVEGSETDREGKRAPVRVANTVVIEADELYVGDGRVLRPGQVLVHKGRIAEVGERVAHPSGAVVVHGPAAMPGIIDTLGFLGLEGSGRVPAPDFKLARIIEPGDETDRRVAKAGVTTVVLSPRGSSGNGAPMMAYKPAATDFASMVIADPAALRLQWTDRNRLESGKSLTQLLEKARDYDKKWREYEEAIAKWVPPPPEAEKTDEKKDGDKASGDKKDESGEKKDEASTDKDKKDDKKDEKKKGKGEDEADPVSGIWLAKVTVPPFAESARLRLRLELKGEEVTGSVRCDQVSVTLVELTGTWKEKKVDVSGLGTRGTVRIDGEAKDGKLDARLTLGKTEIKFQAERETKELPVAGRTEARRDKSLAGGAGEEKKEPKGKPKQPNTDEKLEPFRRAMRGDAAIVVGVDREDEILACVDAFAKVGIKPVLFGAEDAWRIADKIASRISGVLLSQQVLDVEQGKGLADERNRYEELAAAGIPVAFYSQAEEGAAELATMAAYAVALGLSPEVALRALTSDAAHIMAIDERVGRLAVGLDGDVLLLDGAPLEPATSVLRAWVNGEEIR
jgi:imidazolonepropionase-like amidohydrolase